MSDALVGIDVGTSGVKGLAIDERGEVLAVAEEHYALQRVAGVCRAARGLSVDDLPRRGVVGGPLLGSRSQPVTLLLKNVTVRFRAEISSKRSRERVGNKAGAAEKGEPRQDP